MRPDELVPAIHMILDDPTLAWSRPDLREKALDALDALDSAIAALAVADGQRASDDDERVSAFVAEQGWPNSPMWWAEAQRRLAPGSPTLREAQPYDHTKPSAYTEDDCHAAVGTKATLALTGTIISAGSSDTGPYVKFIADERWGFGSQVFGLDLDALALAAAAGGGSGEEPGEQA